MYYFIVNPNSRSGHGLHLRQEAENILKEKKIEYEVFFTEYPVGRADKGDAFQYGVLQHVPAVFRRG